MTIRITVKNEDSRKDAVVNVSQVGDSGQPVSGSATKVLKGGEACEMYVHGGNNILVKESKPDETVQQAAERGASGLTKPEH